MGPLQCLVIDTVGFQRLRYIRQNGLLHFIFPGAVHSRFAHSIGAMWNARRLFERLFPRADSDGSREYVNQCFQLAALLHDVGHCAFSHAIEGISLLDQPLFPPPRKLIEQWGAEEDVSDELRSRWTQWVDELPQDTSPAKHEEIGQLIVEAVFQDQSVSAHCEQQKYDPMAMATDVRALLSKTSEPSDRLDRAFLSLLNRVDGKPPTSVDESQGRKDLLKILRSFISGTLDVDRLDYLARDSLYAGTCYGKCDTEVLLNGLGIAWSLEGRLRPVLRERALDALDDMLWSRFQHFQQVLNHKTNVLLNAMLHRAVREAMLDDQVHLKPPRSLGGYLRFTDDLVMSAVFSHCAGGLGKSKAYGQALVHRILPRHLGVVEREPGQSEGDFDKAVDAARNERAATLRIPVESVQTWKARIEIFKDQGAAPWIQVKERHGVAHPLVAYSSKSRLYKSMSTPGPQTGNLALGLSIRAHLYEYEFD